MHIYLARPAICVYHAYIIAICVYHCSCGGKLQKISTKYNLHKNRLEPPCSMIRMISETLRCSIKYEMLRTNTLAKMRSISAPSDMSLGASQQNTKYFVSQKKSTKYFVSQKFETRSILLTFLGFFERIRTIVERLEWRVATCWRFMRAKEHRNENGRSCRGGRDQRVVEDGGAAPKC